LNGIACNECAEGFTSDNCLGKCFYIYIPLLLGLVVLGLLFLKKWILLCWDSKIPGRAVKLTVVSLSFVSSVAGAIRSATYIGA
jgi:hypothetical protein